MLAGKARRMEIIDFPFHIIGALHFDEGRVDFMLLSKKHSQADQKSLANKLVEIWHRANNQYRHNPHDDYIRCISILLSCFIAFADAKMLPTRNAYISSPITGRFAIKYIKYKCFQAAFRIFDC